MGAARYSVENLTFSYRPKYMFLGRHQIDDQIQRLLSYLRPLKLVRLSNARKHQLTRNGFKFLKIKGKGFF